MDIRIKEVINNLKNYDFDILGNYKMDGAEAKKLIEAIEETDKKIADYTYTIGLLQDRIEVIEKSDTWIPVSERQPEKNGNYLAFYRTSDGTAVLEFIMVDHCNAGGGWLHEVNGKTSYKKVIAWMPLPQPYKAESEGKGMTVGELITELNKYDTNQRVLLCAHGRCAIEEQDEILGCYEEEICDENDDVVEKVITLYEY